MTPFTKIAIPFDFIWMPHNYGLAKIVEVNVNTFTITGTTGEKQTQENNDFHFFPSSRTKYWHGPALPWLANPSSPLQTKASCFCHSLYVILPYCHAKTNGAGRILTNCAHPRQVYCFHKSGPVTRAELH